MVILENEKLTVRTWCLGDEVSLAENANNINVWDNVRDYFPHPYSIQDGRDFIAYAGGKSSPEDFTIVIDGFAVGGVGFVPQTDVERISAEIGYWLGEPYWGRGIMSEAVAAVVRYVFTETGHSRLFAPVFGFNTGSMRVLEHNGFTKVAILHKAAIKNGQVIDMHYYELLKP